MTTRTTDPATILTLTTDMPDVDTTDGENWAEIATEAWTAAFAERVEVEQIDTDLRPEHIYDGRTAAYLRIGAEWYRLDVEASDSTVRVVPAR